MLLAFVPMLFIAAAYYYLNRADPDCGTTFTWVTRAIGPKTGWMAGWGILVTDLVVMPNLASIAGVYTFSLFGAHGIAANSSGFWVTFVGVVWIVVMTAICYIGIELSARTQVALLGAEIVILVVFAVVALVKVYGGHVAHSVRPSFEWLNPFKIPSHRRAVGRDAPGRVHLLGLGHRRHRERGGQGLAGARRAAPPCCPPSCCWPSTWSCRSPPRRSTAPDS